ncbi:MAG: glycosyltransferase [Ignavibacterium sp.]|uniref:glycosyltransferase n=1 Tax=Ignavibacterium sp. TaxID=2651167 RepID=UPI003299F79A
MKILLLSNIEASHTQKWANSLIENDIDVYLFGLGENILEGYHHKINIITVKIPASTKLQADGALEKSIYLKSIPRIYSLVKKIKPDIMHAHYASSYGLLGALTGFKPFIVSVWGNDVFDFPQKSFLHKWILKFVLRKADRIYSTSKVMANETNLYTSKEIGIIPFGVDTEIFKPFTISKMFDEDTIVLGTVKSLSYKYGIEYLLEAFKIIKEKLPDRKIKLLLVGDGILKNSLQRKAEGLNINNDVIFYGSVPHSKVPEMYNMIDIAVFPSVWESFGVSNLEAAACEKPQVASNVGGFPEIIDDSVTGFLAEPENPKDIADKVIKLINDKSLRIKMGKSARKKVIKEFNWNDNVQTMILEYKKVLEGRNK